MRKPSAQSQLAHYQTRFSEISHELLPQSDTHIGEVYHAMHYSFFAGGKHLRPALIYALAESLFIPLEEVDRLAFAIECIHTYSLIHDDLPAMDDDDLRRGKPACHKQFGEATAILAGDALNTLAFEVLATPEQTKTAKQRLQQIAILAECAGVSGMIGGQDTDLTCETETIDLTTLQLLHHKKTAKLIEACFSMTYLAAENTCAAKSQILLQAAQSLGLYYQIQDDILDVTQKSSVLGKPSGSDISKNKTTYVSLLGLAGAQSHAQKNMQSMITAFTQFFDDQYAQTPLANIINFITHRNY